MSAITREDLGYYGSIKNLVRQEGRYGYNCAGYAFESFDWYQPSHFSHRTLQREYNGVYTCAQRIVEDFQGLVRIIKEMSELKENEYLVAFRTGPGDFHFVKRASNGNWRHKRGISSKIERMSKKEVFSDNWASGKYISPVVLFAVVK